MLNKKKKITNEQELLLALTIFMCVFIFVMSSQDGTKSSELSSSFMNTYIGKKYKSLPIIGNSSLEHSVRKYAHISEYVALGIFSTTLLKTLNIDSAAALLFCVLYASSDEFHQTFVPGRCGCVGDVGYDTVGSAIGIVLAAFAYSMFSKGSARKV